MTKDFIRPKNNKNFKRQAGQILIIFLLVLVVGLALVLSVASRSITDIRLTTSSDESNRAYFAAEAGVEEALKQLQKGPYTGGELDFTAINQTTAKVNVSVLSPGTADAFLFPEEYDRDSVAQVSLLVDFNNIGSGNPPGLASGTLAVYYGSGTGSDEPAIEVSIVHRNSGTGVWGIKKFAFDSEVRGNGFCNVTAGTTTVATQDGDRTFSHLASIDFINGYPAPAGCSGGPVLEGIGSDTAILARIRFLYNDVPETLAVGTEGSFVLPDQGTEVISTGSTVSGVTRKLKVTQLFPSLPAIFDYVLFSGSDLIK